MAVPVVVDLEAADVEAAPSGREARLGEGEGLVAALEPVALPLAVDRPGPGAQAAAVGPAGLGQRDRVQHLLRHPDRAGAGDDGALADRRVRLGRAGWRAAEREEQEEGDDRPAAEAAQHGTGLPDWVRRL